MFRSTAGQRTNRTDDVIIGMAKFQRSLHAVDTTMIRKTLGVACRKGAAPVLKAMRTEAKPISKTIARSFGVKIKIYKRSKTAIALIGVRNVPGVRKKYTDPINKYRGKGDSKGIHDPRFTFHLVDLGTKPHMAKAFGAYFMHPGTRGENVRGHALTKARAQSDAAFLIAFKNAVEKELR